MLYGLLLSWLMVCEEPLNDGLRKLVIGVGMDLAMNKWGRGRLVLFVKGITQYLLQHLPLPSMFAHIHNYLHMHNFVHLLALPFCTTGSHFETEEAVRFTD